MANRPRRLEVIFQSYTEPLYFVTFNTYKRSPILATEAVHLRFIEFASEAAKRHIAVGRYVIMPDHIHLFVRGHPEFELSGWVRLLKRCLSQSMGEALPHWQEGFFDHLVRHTESYAEKWEYVHQNPVRAGLVEEAERWAYQGEIVCTDRA